MGVCTAVSSSVMYSTLNSKQWKCLFLKFKRFWRTWQSSVIVASSACHRTRHIRVNDSHAHRMCVTLIYHLRSGIPMLDVVCSRNASGPGACGYDGGWGLGGMFIGCGIGAPCIGGVWICGGGGNPWPGGGPGGGNGPIGCCCICCMWCGEYCGGNGPPAMGCGGGSCCGICWGICCGGGWSCCWTFTPWAPAWSINWQLFRRSMFFSRSWSFLASSTRRSAMSWENTNIDLWSFRLTNFLA